jgi:hypothetical protein
MKRNGRQGFEMIAIQLIAILLHFDFEKLSIPFTDKLGSGLTSSNGC